VERSVAFDKELAQPSRIETIQEADENAHQENGGESNFDSHNIVGSFASEKVELTEEDHVSTFANIGAPTVEARDVLQSPPKNLRRSAIDLPPSDPFSPDLTDAIRMLRRISQDFERTMAVEDEAMNHSMRMKAIDELLQSHTYAVEMRQAAKSASTWLRSIDRSDGTSDEKGHQMGESEDVGHSSEPKTAQDVCSEIYASETNEEKNLNQSAGDEHKSEIPISTGEIDMTALKSMLYSAELKAKEKEDLALRLNAELSKCRAEIGRLKTASRAEVSGLEEPKMMCRGIFELKCVSSFVFITNRSSLPLPIDPYWMTTTSRRPRQQTTLVVLCSMISSTMPVRFLGHKLN
jgi:hypothetical protein